MKSLTESIVNELRVSNVATGTGIKYHPKTKGELKDCIKKEIEIQGNNANLNCIDTSKITDMSHLFQETEFNGDISRWDVSRVKDMCCMFFKNYYFNGDLSKWNVGNVKDMSGMFFKSAFNGDISQWDVRSVTDMSSMFQISAFSGENGDISGWDVSNVENMQLMFAYTKFSGDVVSHWVLKKKCDTSDIFKRSTQWENSIDFQRIN